MTQLYANNAKTTLASGVTDVATSFSLSVGTGALFPSPTGGDFFMATLFEYGTGGEINHEIVKCTARSGDTLTVERGQESTTNRAWSTGTRLELRLTKAALDTYVTKTDPQTLTTKTIVAANNTITTAASGNLTSTELNAALAELQTDVDTRALQTYASAINTALLNHDDLSSGTHGVTGTILGTEDVGDIPQQYATTTPISANWAYEHQNATTGTHGVTGTILGTEDVDDTPVNGATTVPVSSNWAYDHQNATTGTHGVTGTILGTEDVDDTPVNGATTVPVSSNWAYNHAYGADPHSVYPALTHNEYIAGAWTFNNKITVGATTGSVGLEIGTHTVTTETDLAFNANAIMATSQSLSFGSEMTYGGAIGDVFKWYAGVTSRLTGSGGGTLIAAIDDSGILRANFLRSEGLADLNGGIDLEGEVREENYTISGTAVSLDPNNGTLQKHTLTGATTYSIAAGFGDGESMTLHVDQVAANYSVTWPSAPTLYWIGGSAPDLSDDGEHVISLWKVGTYVVAAYVGVFA